jgi:hypothetical protein
MKKQRILIILLVTVFALSSYCNSTPKKFTPEELKAKREAFLKLSPQERAKVIEERKKKIESRSGGSVRNTKNQHGRILVVNTQTTIPLDITAKSIKKLAERLCIAIDFENAPSASYKDAKKLLSKKETCAIIFISEDKKCDVPMLIAPDSCWASVNTAALGDTNLEKRVQREVLRAFSYLCGGTSSSYPNPMSYPVTNVKQLDLIDNPELPIDVILRFPAYLKSLGVTPYVQATYRTACRQGWAPAPTNDVQKAIWDKVHAAPKNPMKIEFDPKKGR